LEDPRIMLRELNSTCLGKLPLFVSDELPHYKTVLEETFSHYEPVPRTGKPGRPAKPVRTLNADLMYATVKKIRKKDCVVKLERTMVFGDEASIADHLAASPSNLINTAYVERSNLNWRIWDAHLTRKSVTFAKALR
jgi:hypothetical protein